MTIVRCNRCETIFPESEILLKKQKKYCPHCKKSGCLMDLTGTETQYSDKQLEKLWLLFGDIPMDPISEKIEDDFLIFPAGTNREDIWHWFDVRYSRGVADLMYST